MGNIEAPRIRLTGDVAQVKEAVPLRLQAKDDIVEISAVQRHAQTALRKQAVDLAIELRFPPFAA